MSQVQIEPRYVDDYPPAWPPTQEELPYSDGEPMESWRHVLQLRLLLDALLYYLRDRDDIFVGANMFVHYQVERAKSAQFKGPDLFVVLGTHAGDRLSWVVWEEGKGPDIVIELLSRTTARNDRGEKKRVYEQELRVPEYFWYDPQSGEFAGWMLQCGTYQPKATAADDSLACGGLGLRLVPWRGVYEHVDARWLRWVDAGGALLPTPAEDARIEHNRAEEERAQAEEARQRAEEERRRAEDERRQAEASRQRVAELEARLAQYEERFGPPSP
ncbi:MAG: Uma2 family endonuclease [Chloroflexi bacterium]|nr:Uma2 family endonuclease [Chloroflexota bacterium]